MKQLKALVFCTIVSLSLTTSLKSFESDPYFEEDYGKVFLNYCTHFGDGVSFGFESCSNSNFSQIERALDRRLFLSRCSNFGQTVSYSFLSCIQRNFSQIDAEFSQAFLSYCNNFSRDNLDFGFVSCVNRNFSEIERALRSSR